MTSASIPDLQLVFNAHASPTGTMGRKGFAAAMRNLHADSVRIIDDAALEIFFQVADRDAHGVLSLVDFQVFYDLLSKPNAEFDVAFRLFDVERRGKVLEKFAPECKLDLSPKSGGVVSLYFGADASTKLSYQAFSQFLRDIQQENLKQAFRRFDKTLTSFVSVEDFIVIINQVLPHKLSAFVALHLPTVANIYTTGGPQVSWAMVEAFNNVIHQMDLIQHIASAAASLTPDHRVTRRGFLDMCHRMTRFSAFSPMEIDIIFHFAFLNHKESTNDVALAKGISMQDFQSIHSGTEHDVVHSPPPKIIVQKIPAYVGAIRQVYNFSLGSVAGAIGATVVYPIDLVKTRMQNQRSAVVGEVLYKNSWDCFKKVVRNEGVKGLYSGLGPQLIGVAPEKAIKLTMNDLMRGMFKDKKTGEIPIWAEVLAGCTAGGSQVVFTNPLEIVKIRLQIQGELLSGQRRTALDIIKELGIIGLYKGASACLLRDIPFSGIYFTAYAHLKKDYFGESETYRLNMFELLAAGAIAGMPAAYLTTPADVIKTRLQVEAKKGESTYSGIRDAFRKILKEEGAKAFFKGGPARILRSSPQFGVTLMSYELFKQWFPLPWDAKPSTLPPVLGRKSRNVVLSTFASPLTRPSAESDDGFLRMRNTLQLLRDIDYRFGSPSTIASCVVGK